MWSTSDKMPASFPENGILKMVEETITPIKPATAELKINQTTTEPANLPAKPRFTRVAQAGLNAAKIKIGTNNTKNLITEVVPEDMNSNVTGNNPPKIIPRINVKRVQK